MAQRQTGNIVSRAASTGGRVKRQRSSPSNFYVAMVVIVILGFLSVAFARYERNHNAAAAASKVQPVVGLNPAWYAGLQNVVCGTVKAPIPPSKSNVGTGLTTVGNGVLRISPVNSKESGTNATFDRFLAGYTGSNYFVNKSLLTIVQTYTNGEKCPAGTPDAGKKGFVRIALWPNTVAKTPSIVTNDPANIPLRNNSFIVVTFGPRSAKQTPPSKTLIEQVVSAAISQPTVPVTSTTVPKAK